jgi:TolB-like protein/Flp pilus assembly protein TadD
MKDELLKEVWPDAVVEESIITQNVFALRKVLGQDRHNRQYIETIPKRGYRFVADVKEIRVNKLDPPPLSLVKVDLNHETNEGRGKTVSQNLAEKSHPAPVPNTKRDYRPALLVLLTLAVCIGAFLYWQLHQWKRQAVSGSIAHSMAVLPFKPLGADSGDELLGLGMADAIIIKLNNFQQLPVLPTSAIFRYTGREIDPLYAGHELNVDVVLTGTVQHAGERVRVTVKLLSLRDGSLLWSRKFDEQFTNIFAVQDSISEQVAAALAIQLTLDQRKQLAKRYTENTEAYQAYLMGFYFWAKRSKDGLNRSVEYFKQAIEKDPNYALAYAGLADSYFLIVHYNYDPLQSKELYEKAEASASKALELDETLSEAHMVMAMVQKNYEHDDEKAKRSMRQAIELNPNYATAHLRYAWFLTSDGLLNEALREMRRSQELDPLSPTNNVALGNLLIFVHQYDEALRYCQRAVEIDPNNVGAFLILGEAYEQKGRYDEAAAQYKKAEEIEGKTGDVLSLLGHLYASSGQREDAQKLLVQLLKLEKREDGYSYGIALIYAALGQKDQAFERLEKAILNRSAMAWDLRFDPLLDSLRVDPRFSDLLRRHDLGHLISPSPGY